jgi:hypothetical protein
MKVKYEEIDPLLREWIHNNISDYLTDNIEEESRSFFDSIGWTLSEYRQAVIDNKDFMNPNDELLDKLNKIEKLLNSINNTDEWMALQQITARDEAYAISEKLNKMLDKTLRKDNVK